MGKVIVLAKENNDTSWHIEEIKGTLKGQQDFVLGYITYVKLDQYTIVCDEEGDLKRLTYNTKIRGQRFVGPIFITKLDHKGNLVSLSGDEVRDLMDELIGRSE